MLADVGRRLRCGGLRLPCPRRTVHGWRRLLSAQPSAQSDVPLVALERLDPSAVPSAQQLWVRARVQHVRVKGGAAFLLLRAPPNVTLQACFFRSRDVPQNSQQEREEEALQQQLRALSPESVVDVRGSLLPVNASVSGGPVRGATLSNVELHLDALRVTSRPQKQLPFSVVDAAHSEAAIEASQSSARPYVRVGSDLRFDNRWLDLRVPAHNATMRIRSHLLQEMRQSLLADDFVEINSPKLVGGVSEGGADVFHLDYFGRPACLAQSPQLYKQLAIASDLGRVFEVGPVFRAENSNTRRHLCEFTGFDLEMKIEQSYREVLSVVHRMFRRAFSRVEQTSAAQLELVREMYPGDGARPVDLLPNATDSDTGGDNDEPMVVLHWDEAIRRLRDRGADASFDEDLSSTHEVQLGHIVKEEFGVDLFFVDQYPLSTRPFYTMPSEEDPRLSNSYDLFFRGQEISSGAQRCHDPHMLEEAAKRHEIPLEPLRHYLNAFQHAVHPHAGAGIGLDRVVALFLGLENVRQASMFPRDPQRCAP